LSAQCQRSARSGLAVRDVNLPNHYGFNEIHSFPVSHCVPKRLQLILRHARASASTCAAATASRATASASPVARWAPSDVFGAAKPAACQSSWSFEGSRRCNHVVGSTGSLNSPTGRTVKVRARLARVRPASAPRTTHSHARACGTFCIFTIYVPTVLVRHHRHHEGRRGEGDRGRQDDGLDGLLQAREAHDPEDKRAYRLRAGAGGHGRGRLAQGGGAAAHAKCLLARSAL
jgi:hypothetical protein